ncbi:hypothetical protein ACFYV5_16030 [Streptomyces sp. NPDC003035]|uniref:hypothetical protein n=1 Tax=Streptomyces sp. NPDC003035 TaxID=3364676 RepID=UPI0036BDF173
MDEDEVWLQRHGLHPDARGLAEVRELLAEQTRLERGAQGDGYTPLMKLCCVQLFLAGALDDVLLIWRAKTASFDADCSIDIQLLCGAGLQRTKTYLASYGSEEAESALRRLRFCEEAEDFVDFSPEQRSALYAAYYA